MNLILQRDAPRTDCQEGILNDANGSQWYTMERPWLSDRPGLSCVPPGIYGLVPHTIAHGALFGLDTYALSNPDSGVFPEPPSGYAGNNPVRVAILIHPANWAFELEGCIAPGKSRGWLRDLPAVLSSKQAFEEILASLGGTNQSGNTLTIIAWGSA